MGFPVFPLEWHDPKSGEVSSGYREQGYLPQAVVNMLALLGWNPGKREGDNGANPVFQEMMTMEELIRLFSIEHISKNGARFNLDKARWFQHEYFQQLPDSQVAEMLGAQVREHGIEADAEYVARVAGMMKERITFPSELWDTCCYFFQAPTEYNEKDVAKRWQPGMPEHMRRIVEILNTVPFEYEALHKAILEDYIKAGGLNTGAIMNSLRLAVVGRTVGPDMLTLILMLGKEETIGRVERAVEKIGEGSERK